jgi:hypothetical protein
MSERPIVRADSEPEHPAPLELPREPNDDTDDTDGAADHQSHDPYQPL